MENQTLKLDHNTFTFEIIEGVIQKVAIWEQTSTETNKNRHNKHEFWMKDDQGNEYYFVVNANRVSIKPKQKVRLLITSGKKTEPVLVYNLKNKELFTNVTVFGLVMNEAPLLNVGLMIGAVIGLFFALGPALLSALYTGLLLFMAMRWFTRLGFYKNRLDGIKTKYFEQKDRQ